MIKKIYLSILTLTALFLLPWTGVKAETLKIGTNTSSTYGAPVYVTWADEYYCSQILYSSSELSALNGQQITKLAFFLRGVTGNSKDYDYVQIRLLEVDYDEFASAEYVSISGAAFVFEGTLPASTSTTLEVTLDEPFVYNGGNLLVDVRKTVSGGGYAPYSGSNKGRFQATSGSKTTVLYNYASGAFPTTCSSMAVRPDIRFTYEEAVLGSCTNKPGTPVASDITANSTTLTWTAAEGVTNYQFVRVAKGATPDWTGVTPQAVTTVTYNDLTKFTDYDFYVRSYCDAGDGNQSAAVKVSFKTLKSCFEPTTLGVDEITSSSAKITWYASGHGETQWQYTYGVYGSTPNWTGATVTNEKEATLSGLNPATPYQVWVRSYCDENDQSEAITEYFMTECDAISSFPWNENFEGMTANDVPICWDNSNSGTSTISSYPERVWGVYEYSSNKMLRMYNYYVQAGTALINTPSIVLPASPAYELSFDYAHNASCGNFVVKVSTDGGSSFTAIDGASYAKGSGSSYYDPIAFTPTNIDLSSYAGQTIILQFFATSDYNSGAIFLDNMSIHEKPSCTTPGMPEASSIATNSASIAWAANSGESKWNLEYSTDGENWTVVNNVTDNPYALTGLTASTLYYVRVKALCSATDESSYSAVGSFRTACGTISTLPWNYGFEDATIEALPTCWNSIPYDYYGTDVPYVDNYSTAHGGSNYLYYYGGGSSSASIAILPQFAEQISGLALSFYYMNSSINANYAKLKVGYITNPADKSTFVAVETLEQVTSYTKAGPFVFTNAPEGSFIAIQYAGASSAYGSAYIDDVTVDVAPSCIQPSGLAASSVTDNSASITWTAGGSESAWVLQYKAYDGDWSADINVTSPSYPLTGLAANTNYYVHVKAVCDANDESDWSSSINFKTACGVNAMPFTEDFGTTSAIPDCWTVGKTGGTYQWAPNYDTYPNYYLQFRTSSGSTYSYLTLPAIALTEDAQLTFDWRNSNNVTADLLISTDGGATFTSIPNHGLSTTASSWTAKKYDLSAYTGETVIISIQGYNGTSSRYLRIDNIRVEAKPCEALAAPTAVPTVDGGTITWTGNAKALRYQAVGASTWNTVAVTTTSYLLTGQEASTSYNVQVQAACATGDDDLWSNSLTFTTRCAATDELPYSNNFDAEESSEMPACWSKISTTDYPYVYSGSAAYGGTGKFLYFQGNTEQIAVLPALTADLSTLTFSLYYKGGSANFQLGYVKADGVTFVALEPLPALSAFGAEPYELDLASIPAEAKYLAIRYSSTSNYASGYVDNVVVKKTPTCFKPASIAASAITANSATVAWTASGKGETQYQYVCVPAGETPDWTAATLTDELSATLTTLAPTTEYDFYVRSYCGTEDQSDAVKTSFTTKCAAAALPFDEDFDAVADYDMPECWNVYAATYYAAYVANGQLHADAPKTNATVIVLPELEASFVGASVSFNYSTSNGTLQVGYVTDAEDKNSFVAVSEALTAASTTQVLVPFTAGSGNIAFRFIGNTGDGDLYLDNVRVSTTLVLADGDDNGETLGAYMNKTIDVTIDRTLFCDGDFNTLCLPFDLPSLDGTPLAGGELWAFKYGYVENGELLVRIIEADAVQAGVPYLITFDENMDNIASPLFKNVTIAASAGVAVGQTEDVQFVGIMAPELFTKDDHTKLFVVEDGRLAWSGVENSSLKAFRAFFQTVEAVGSNSGSAPIRHGMPARIVKQENSATGFENVQFDAQTLKLIENGNVVIIRNGVKYNIQGQVISK